VSDLLHEEEAEVMRLQRHDIFLREKVAATRAEVHELRERDAEFAAAHMEGRAEVLEARSREARARNVGRARDAQAGRLCQQVTLLNERLDRQRTYYQDQCCRLEDLLQDEQACCSMFEDELRESEQHRVYLASHLQKCLANYGQQAWQTEPATNVFGHLDIVLSPNPNELG